MQWGFLLLLLSGVYAAIVSIFLHKKTDRLKYLGLFLASLLFSSACVGHIVSPLATGTLSTFIVGQLIEWGHIYCISLVLSSLLLFVRESKPEFSRFPIVYVSFPAIIVISYLLVYNTVILKDWLVSIYHAGAGLVAMLIYGVYSYRESMYNTAFAGSLILFSAFITYLVLPLSYEIIWQLLLALGTATVFSGFLIVDKQLDQAN